MLTVTAEAGGGVGGAEGEQGSAGARWEIQMAGNEDMLHREEQSQRGGVSAGERADGALIRRHQEETLNVQINSRNFASSVGEDRLSNNYLLSGCRKRYFPPTFSSPISHFVPLNCFKGKNLWSRID